MEKSTNSGDLNFPWRIAVEFKEPEVGNQTRTFLLISAEKPRRSLAGGGGEEGCARAHGPVQIILVIFQ